MTIRRPSRAARWTGAVVVLLLAGCTGGGMSDLKAYVDRIKTKPGGRVEPVPEIKSFETFHYDEAGRGSPFAARGPERGSELKVGAGGVRPDMNRRKEALESFPLDALRMVGTLDRGNQKWALISAPDKMVYRVTVGNHLGQNFGHVKSVTEDKILMTEVVPDGQGGWIERDAALALTE